MRWVVRVLSGKRVRLDYRTAVLPCESTDGLIVTHIHGRPNIHECTVSQRHDCVTLIARFFVFVHVELVHVRQKYEMNLESEFNHCECWHNPALLLHAQYDAAIGRWMMAGSPCKQYAYAKAINTVHKNNKMPACRGNRSTSTVSSLDTTIRRALEESMLRLPFPSPSQYTIRISTVSYTHLTLPTKRIV